METESYFVKQEKQRRNERRKEVSLIRIVTDVKINFLVSLYLKLIYAWGQQLFGFKKSKIKNSLLALYVQCCI